MKKLWGGRFTGSAEDWVDEFGASIGFDQELAKEDIEGSMAHASMLAQCGIISTEEADEMITGLKKLKEKAENGELEYSAKLEDIHLNIEHHLTELIGPIGGKLHTARSKIGRAHV